VEGPSTTAIVSRKQLPRIPSHVSCSRSLSRTHLQLDVDKEAAGQGQDEQRDEPVEVEGEEETGERAQQRRDPVGGFVLVVVVVKCVIGGNRCSEDT
jgi:hypothetical protein